MLLYYFILILLLGSGIAAYIYTAYAYQIYDTRYDIPYRSGFDHQNCQIDRSCWVPYSTAPDIPEMPKLRPPFMGSNKICLKSPYVARGMPPVFFQPRYGWNAYANIA